MEHSHPVRRFSPQDVTLSPGVYVFRNSSGEVIYVGKARSLRKRLSSYFRPSAVARADPKVRALINSIASYEVFPVKTESEALLLESRFIKEYAPRYNVSLRDDKRFLLICVDPTETFPRLRLTRLRKDDGRVDFGPFPRAGALRQTLRQVAAHVGLRTCSARLPTPETRRRCIHRSFSQCSCPCTGKVTAAEYASRLDAAYSILRGETSAFVDHVRTEVRRLAGLRRFEDAAHLRDVLENLKAVCSPHDRRFSASIIQTGKPTDAGLLELQELLSLASPPRVIECFDISNIGGRLAVGSMVCFRDGRPSPRDYRRYRVRAPEPTDDAGMLRHVVARRYQRVCREGLPVANLVVIDGGRTQLAAATDALALAGMSVPAVLALAKKREEVYVVGRDLPLLLARTHPALRLLQALRDEAHRFALSYHRQLRRRRIRESVLCEVSGVGPKRQALLLGAFGSLRGLAAATPEQIAVGVPGLGLSLARQIKARACEPSSSGRPAQRDGHR